MSRIIAYGEKTGYDDGDYLLIDNGEGGTKRIRADRVGIQLDPTLTAPNKAAPADKVKKLDATLTHSGQAADSKVVGDEIADLKEDLNITNAMIENIVAHSDNFLDPSKFQTGKYIVNGGDLSDNANLTASGFLP